MPANLIRIDTVSSRYPFDSLKHGDAIEVRSRLSAQEMFRRWRKARGRQARLISSPEDPKVLFFIDDDVV